MTRNSKRIALNMRTYRELYEAMRRAAAASGRSLSAECEYRIERSFWRDDQPPKTHVAA